MCSNVSGACSFRASSISLRARKRRRLPGAAARQPESPSPPGSAEARRLPNPRVKEITPADRVAAASLGTLEPVQEKYFVRTARHRIG